MAELYLSLAQIIVKHIFIVAKDTVRTLRKSFLGFIHSIVDATKYMARAILSLWFKS